MRERNLFPPTHRLRTQQDFRQVFRSGRKFPSRHLAIFVANNTLDHARLGVVIAKKNVKLAVDRNRLKRITREDFRYRQHDLNILDCTVIVYKGANELTRDEFRQCLERQWQKVANYYKKSS